MQTVRAELLQFIQINLVNLLVRNNNESKGKVLTPRDPRSQMNVNSLICQNFESGTEECAEKTALNASRLVVYSMDSREHYITVSLVRLQRDTVDNN